MLILVRHGQSEANLAGLLVGRIDSPLTRLGLEQAGLVGEALSSSIDAPYSIITSPLQRAVMTAEAIAGAFEKRSVMGDVEVDERFLELDYGELDGCAPRDLPAGLFDHWRSDAGWRPPGGETLEELGARVATACEQFASQASNGNVIIVSHVSPIKAAIVWAIQGRLEMSWRLSLNVASITRIITGGSGGAALLSFNETAHLGGAVA